MNNRRKFLVLYFAMVCALILRIFLDEQLALKAKYLYDRRYIVLTIISRVIDILYYIITYFGFIALCKIERGSILLETVLLGIPALLLLVMSVVITAPFTWIFTNPDYCVPFGAMLLCILLYRWRNKW